MRSEEDDTGVFTLTFTTSTQEQGNVILVRSDSYDVMVGYTDEFPADFMGEKTFIFTISMTIDGGPAVTPSVPKVVADGTPSAGKQMMLSIAVTNHNDDPLSFWHLVEVRYSSGITVFLAWQSAVADPLGQTEIGVSWTPDSSGDYEIRTFAITGLDNPRVLSEVRTAEFIIE